uniref:Uncharacterized protein n=1 Tax=Cajanus cajan TaxID=3821 RepID=A0A151RUH7_CAJCA|nr:hypothetical protein KK1_032275 [Cajanus cajan]
MVRGNSSSGNNGGGGNPPNPPPLDPALNPLSVYYIAPGENPSMALVSPLLTVKNYHSWSRGMKRSLISKNKFKFVNGSLPMPHAFDPSFDAWERCNNLVLSWILNSVEPTISQSIVYIEVAVVAWKLLKDRFSQADRVRVFELQEELMSLKQGANSVAQFFKEMTTIWDEIASTNGKQFREEDCIMKFLSGLNDEFDVVRTQILMMEPFPDINKALSLVLQHERRIGGLNNNENQVLINAAECNVRF